MTGWLKCEKVSEGIFTNEIGIKCYTRDGIPFNMFAWEDLLQQKNNTFYLKVTVLEETPDGYVVVLPDFPFEMNRVIMVSNDDILFNI